MDVHGGALIGLFKKARSPFWWYTLEGTNRRQESTKIRYHAVTAEQRKQHRADAEAIYHARMTQLARSRVGLPLDSRETFATFAAWFEKHVIATHRSAPRERVILAHLRAAFGSLRLADVRPVKWLEYATARRAAGVSVNTIGRELALMKSLLTAAVGEHLDVSPLAHVKRQSTRLPAKRTITAEEHARLLAELHDEEMRDAYLVGVGTLLRQVNIVNLQRRELHGSRLVVMTKTGPHVVSLDGPTVLQTQAADVLRRRLSTPGVWVFPRWHGLFERNRDSGNSFFLKGFRRAVKRAGIPWGLNAHGVVWHTATRASGATRMLRDYGIDVRTVQLIGGWRSLDQMAEYLGVDLTIGSRPTGAVDGASRVPTDPTDPGPDTAT